MISILLLVLFLIGAGAFTHVEEGNEVRAPQLSYVTLTPLPQTTPPAQRHVLQFGVGYMPGPGLSVFGQYIFTGLPSDYTVVEVGWSRQLFGAFTYTHIIELDPWGEQRLTISPSVFSEYQPNRLLNDVRTHERRTGAGIRSTYHHAPLGRWNYDQYIETEHARVRLDPEENASTITDVTTFETGPRLFRRALTGLLPADLLFEGRLRGGLDHDQEALYGRARLGARWHRGFGAGFAWDTMIHGEWASPDTPVFERASFGGTLSVRGYRQDAIIGRAHWTLQQEIWIPVPGTTDATYGVGAILRHNVRFASFVDVGGVGATSNPDDAAVRTGAGLGLRLRLGGMTLRTDWGHRLADLRVGHLRGDLFVTIRPDLGLFLFE